MRRDVKRNCIWIFLVVHDISCLSLLTLKKNNEIWAGWVFFRLLSIFTLLYSSGKYLNLNSDIYVYSDFINTPTHFISKRQVLLLYSKRKVRYSSVERSLLYITEENKQRDGELIQVPTPESLDIKHQWCAQSQEQGKTRMQQCMPHGVFCHFSQGKYPVKYSRKHLTFLIFSGKQT